LRLQSRRSDELVFEKPHAVPVCCVKRGPVELSISNKLAKVLSTGIGLYSLW
jgi:hypothetical protein